ncbi:MAG: sensor domain-containing diguanylate cyclase [Psychromonas sp.]|nr:sensor domain-containing diguanylate cyclase [Alteromonadales bacterium]MCP5078058.1 sensor domain-containing diguanylate cyclase [Psychromonas sp.]
MKQFVLEQVSITQNAFLSSQDAKGLIATTSHFLSLILHPDETLFCIEADELICLAQHNLGKAICHLEVSATKLKTEISNESLWTLAGQKELLSPHIPITHLAINNKIGGLDNWYCIKLQMSGKSGIFIFMKNPQAESISLWKTEPLLASLMMQFFYLLQQFLINQKQIEEITLRDKQEALYIHDINQQKEFSSKILKLHKMTQDLLASTTLDKLYKIAVESLRDVLGFDRTCLILADAVQHTMTLTYGTDEQGNTTDESNRTFDIKVLEPSMQHTALNTDKLLDVVDKTPLYTAGKVSGIGWNAMVILREGDNLIGWVAIDNLINNNPLLNYEKELLMLYSGMLSSAIVQKREESNLNLLHSSVVELSHQESELEICRVAVEISKSKLKLDRVAIFLSYDNGQTMHGTYGTDINGQIINETDFNGSLPKNTLLALAIDSPHQLAFESSVPLFHNNKIVGHGWNAAMLLRNQDRVIGFLVLDNLINKRPISTHNKHLLSLFASNLAEIIARKRAEVATSNLNNKLEHLVEQRTQQLESVNRKLEQSNKKLAQLSMIDSLTAVANRRQFDETFQIEWATACRYELNLSIIMLDVDYFKAYNDYYGHQQGDSCLQQIAELLNSQFRRADELVARYGGEEFVILIPRTSLSQINERIQAVIDDLFAINIEHLKSPLQKVTLSAGIANFKIDKDIPQNRLLKLADEALYQAKSEGKNRLIAIS